MLRDFDLYQIIFKCCSHLEFPCIYSTVVQRLDKPKSFDQLQEWADLNKL